ncbi:hypothetical protein Acr_08g0009270 [Actinidia rufa]|uniref:Retrotransposon gag domain-containing protein n=1 Tax=Actinidia rufa TaxID=165716 RepID=A0A7J0F1G8_9ERIC|nr:hypothetical protein Acr_08g0009270 [Actinidia rufa]
MWDKIPTDQGVYLAILELVAHGLPKGYSSPNPPDRGKTSPWNLAKSSPLSSPELPSECSSARQELEYYPLLALGRSHAPDLEGLHCEIHDMAEQMRIMNENNGRLMQLLAAANPPPPAAPLIPDVERSRHSNRSGNRSRNISADQVGRGRRQAPSSSLREKSSSESSKTPTRSGRGRSPRRGDHIRARDTSTSQKIRDLDARLDAINTGVGAPVTVDTLIKQTEPPFTERILRARISSKFKLPTQLGIYEGKTDPMDHLDSYKSLMSLQGCSDEVMCKAFSATLKGPARSWFQKLSPGTIDSFGDLSRLFVANFMSCRNRQKNASHLFTIHQKETESLKDFSKADKYIAAEELAEAKRRRRGKDDHKRKELDTRRADYREETRYKRPDRDPKRSNNRRPRTPPRRPEFALPPLNAPVAQVLSEIKHEEKLRRTLGMDQLTDNPGRRASPDHRMAGFYCGRLPLALQCHPGATNFRRNQGDHLDLSPKAKVPHPTGIGEIKGDQKVARQCFISAMRVETSSVPTTQ